MRKLHGVICATLTPFVSDVGPVDYEWIPAHLRWLETNGMHGVLPLGTTGEGVSLGVSERQRVLDLVLQHRGELFVIAGTGCAALTETVALSRYALDRGADALLVVPPFYFKGAGEMGILSYYRAVCDALPEGTRLLLYHIPQVTAVPMTTAIIEGLCESHPNHLYGLKDSSGDIEHTTMLVQRYPQLHIFSGSDAQLANSLAAGVAGGISALSNVWPDLVRGVFDVHQASGDVAAVQQRLGAARQAVPNPTPAPLKAALPWRSDLPQTSVRAPLQNFTEEEAAQMRDVLAAHNVLDKLPTG